MRKKYKTSLILVGFLILVTMTIGVISLFYDKTISNTSLVIATNNISINYLNGNKITVSQQEENIKFSVTNNSNKDVYYQIVLTDVQNYSSQFKLTLWNETLNSQKNILTLDNNQNIIASEVLLSAAKTNNYTLKIQKNKDRNFKFKIDIFEEKLGANVFSNVVLANNQLKKPATPIGIEAALTEEGLISDIDDLGTTYYFRGISNQNYVSFANLTWRIIRINGDKTVRLILDNELDVLQLFSEEKEDYSYENLNIKTFLETWYNEQLKEKESYIALGKYCYDYTLSADGLTSTAYNRIYSNSQPTFNCLSKKVATFIGLISLDEVLYAGASINSANVNYYLYNKEIATDWWTMTISKKNEGTFYPFLIKVDSSLENNTTSSLSKSIRPVINLKSDVIVSGIGTSENPYKIEE